MDSQEQTTSHQQLKPQLQKLKQKLPNCQGNFQERDQKLESLQEQKHEGQEALSTRYTVIPITDPQHQKKLKQYMEHDNAISEKTSFCRFYLRGICIMKPDLCKFAHRFEDLVMEEDDQELLRNCNFTEKQRKKAYFQSRSDFQQKALFILKDVDYLVLYNYQFGQKWKSGKRPNLALIEQQSKLQQGKDADRKQHHNGYKSQQCPFYSISEIKKNRSVRQQIRQVLHRENWAKLVNFLVEKYPGVDFTISLLSKWFSKVGFQKPQTRCRFGDFTRYMVHVMEFKQVNIIMPPSVSHFVYFVNCSEKSRNTLLYENIQQIQKLHLLAKEQHRKSYEAKLKPLPQQLHKTFMCRYFMAGNCALDEKDCIYSHSIENLRFQLTQKFLPQHKQMVKGIEQRLIYISLHKYATEYLGQEITLQELNERSDLRHELRRKMHHKLYSKFMEKVISMTKQQRLQLSQINKYYNAAGFNHSQENKFGQFEASLWHIGYHTEQIKYANEIKKSTYVFKIPPIQELDAYFKKQINSILKEEVKKIKNNSESATEEQTVESIDNAQIVQAVETIEIAETVEAVKNVEKAEKDNKLSLTAEKLQLSSIELQSEKIAKNQQIQEAQIPKLILQSSFRKKLYHNLDHFMIPLHTYLRLKQKNLEAVLKEMIEDKQLIEYIFFETSQQNYKKLVEVCKSFFRSRKMYIFKLEELQNHIKNLDKDQINLNGFINFKGLLQSAVLDCGRKVYFLNFDNNALVIDKGQLNFYEKNVMKANYMLKDYTKSEEAILGSSELLTSDLLYKQRIVVVDNQSSFIFSERFLLRCNKFGVDLEGRLRKNGYIDLIQISAIWNGVKQIFIFDIFKVAQNKDQDLSIKMKKLIKTVLQDQSRVKILHDCKQDSSALYHLMGISLRHVYDISGMCVVLEQKGLYENWNRKETSNHRLLKKVYEVKIPGLNTVLSRYQAPHGVNVLKEKMKKLFSSEGNRQYFESRPIDPDFVEYSAQDVQDLVDVYENMKKADSQKIGQFVGKLFAQFHVSEI